eukprot:TRINITY_DN3299_c0_g1_i1.p1 TRINITY_DN3299_c0_g1~~TRINITY_DN3299_c0_g1_i1.p1  ORF type:complete len:415 (-),score=39.54 TRINITY_DN3299_c0_g1_i1:81-1325(-)
MERLRPILLNWVQQGTGTVVAFQKLCGVRPIPSEKPLTSTSAATNTTPASRTGASTEQSEDSSNATVVPVLNDGARKKERVYGTPTNMFLHYLFVYGTAAGHELFYIIVLPFLYWMLDQRIGRRALVVWGTVFYVGQLLKDVLKLPRPPSPPAMRLSNIYEAEYGMPSTHAMGALSLSMILVIAHYQAGYDFALWKGLALALTHTAVVCLSRLYMGAHSVADIVSGLVLSTLILIPFVVWGEAIDYWFATSGWVPVVVPLIAIVAVLIYPKSQHWSESYGDTVTIIGVAAGSMVGIWSLGVPAMDMSAESIPRQFRLNHNTAEGIILQCLIGFVVVFITRAVLKLMLLALLPRVLMPPRAKAHLHPHLNFDNVYRNYQIEIPTKLLVYSAIGFNACFTSPFLCGQMLVSWPFTD